MNSTASRARQAYKVLTHNLFPWCKLNSSVPLLSARTVSSKQISKELLFSHLWFTYSVAQKESSSCMISLCLKLIYTFYFLMTNTWKCWHNESRVVWISSFSVNSFQQIALWVQSSLPKQFYAWVQRATRKHARIVDENRWRAWKQRESSHKLPKLGKSALTFSSLSQSWLRSHSWKFSKIFDPRKKRIEGRKIRRIQKHWFSTFDF